VADYTAGGAVAGMNEEVGITIGINNPKMAI